MGQGKHTLREPANGQAGPETPWAGSFERYRVGDPGRAATDVLTTADSQFPFREDVATSAARVGGVDIRAASVRGLSHRFYGTVRQDEFAYLTTPRWLVIGVADGVSSGSHSHLAAITVVRSGCRRLAAAVEEYEPELIDWAALLNALADEVTAEGCRAFGLAGRGDVAGRMATTALFAVVELQPERPERRVCLMPFGDTSAWLLRPDDPTQWNALQEVKNEGAAVSSSATAAIPMVPAEVGPQVETTLAPGEVLVLMTDGVGDPLGRGTGDVGQFLTSVWRRPPEPLAFAAQVDFARRTYDDDRTVVAVWPVS